MHQDIHSLYWNSPSKFLILPQKVQLAPKFYSINFYSTFFYDNPNL